MRARIRNVLRLLWPKRVEPSARMLWKLPLDLDLDALDLTPWQRKVAETLQEHGAYIEDQGDRPDPELAAHVIGLQRPL